MKVLLVGHYGRGNLGDRAMLEGIQRAFPEEHELHVVTRKKTRSLRTVEEAPWEVLRAAFESDWIWMGGGSFIHDEATNRRFMHRGLLKVLAIFLVARIARCKLAFIGMGLGPIRRQWKRRLVRFLFSHADYVSLRDGLSIDEWNRCASKGSSHIHLTFDSCVALESCGSNQFPKNDETLTIGLNILPYFTIYHDSPRRDDILLDKIAQSIKRALDGRPARIRVFTYNVKEEESEREMILAAKQVLSEFADAEAIPYQSPQKTIEDIGACDLMIAMRYHGSMMGYIARVPQIVLSYHEKCRALADEVGLPAHSVHDVKDLRVEALTRAMRRLFRNPDTYVAPRPLDDARAQFRDTYFPKSFRL